MLKAHLLKICYWLLGSLVIATLFLKSFDGFLESWLIALFLLTAAIFAKYSYQHIAHLKGFKKGLRVSLIALASLYWCYIAITIAYWYLIELKGGVIDQMIMNPLFIWMIISFFVLLEYQLFRKSFAHIKETVSIFSNRKKTILQIDSIAYIESRSDFTLAIMLNGEEYKNNTTISDWEKMLDSFIRVHRSCLVNPKKCTLKGNEVVINSIWNLPISRKYKQLVIEQLESLSNSETP